MPGWGRFFWKAGRLSVLIAGLWLGSAPAHAQLGTAFVYQGRLSDAGAPANGSYDLQLVLYDAAAGGAQQGPILTLEDVSIVNGLFTVSLDFGPVFDGATRHLEVRVRPGASLGGFITMGPRQALTPAPHALYATQSGNATTVAGLACANTQVAKWSGTSWSCGLDDDTPPTASVPLTVTGRNLALTPCGAGQVYKMAGGVWTCSADLNTTYSNGSGLTLTGTVFATDDTVVARKDAAAGNQAFDTNTLFLDYANNRVGIGTASPSGPLDVQGGTADADTAGAGILVNAQNGGPDGADANGSGGAGGAIRLTAGTGGPGQPAGAIRLEGTTGGAAVGLSNGEGSDVVIVTGRGGSSATTTPAGSGGDFQVSAGDGGINSGGGQSGDGGEVTINAGNGFGGGLLSLRAGNGNSAGPGGSISIGGGQGGAGGGLGGNVTISGGGSSAAAGEVTLLPGTTITGTIGSIQLGGTTSQANTTALGNVAVHVVGGDLSFANAGDGIILRSPNGTVCRLLSISDAGAIVLTVVTCP